MNIDDLGNVVFVLVAGACDHVLLPPSALYSCRLIPMLLLLGVVATLVFAFLLQLRWSLIWMMHHQDQMVALISPLPQQLKIDPAAAAAAAAAAAVDFSLPRTFC